MKQFLLALKLFLLNVLNLVKENPRYLALVAMMAVQALEKAGYSVDSSLVENSMDFLTAIVLGVVAKKSRDGKLL